MRDSSDDHEGVTRRGFVATLGAGAAAAAVGTRVGHSETDSSTDDGLIPVTLRINGRDHRLAVEPRWTLLDAMRQHLGITGPKEGCGRGECGACTVLFGDTPRYACMALAVEAEGHEITTIEGLGTATDLSPLQQAFVEEDALQCGYCTPGQVMAAEGFLRANAAPTVAEIQSGMSGNLCRCGAYVHIVRAVSRDAQRRLDGGES
jgi:xanthine dehydrogenase YagT iron-sulfur-binding subunit